jgi:hypothetical protein
MTDVVRLSKAIFGQAAVSNGTGRHGCAVGEMVVNLIEIVQRIWERLLHVRFVGLQRKSVPWQEPLLFIVLCGYCCVGHGRRRRRKENRFE